MNSKLTSLYERIRRGDLEFADLDQADQSRLQELIRLGKVQIEEKRGIRVLVARPSSTVNVRGGLN